MSNPGVAGSHRRQALLASSSSNGSPAYVLMTSGSSCQAVESFVGTFVLICLARFFLFSCGGAWKLVDCPVLSKTFAPHLLPLYHLETYPLHVLVPEMNLNGSPESSPAGGCVGHGGGVGHGSHGSVGSSVRPITVSFAVRARAGPFFTCGSVCPIQVRQSIFAHESCATFHERKHNHFLLACRTWPMPPHAPFPSCSDPPPPSAEPLTTQKSFAGGFLCKDSFLGLWAC